MAEKISKNVNAKFSMLHGIIIRSTIESGMVLGVSLPKLDSRFFVVGSRDVVGNNLIRILESNIPLFTSSRISYKGQPLLALFGPDTETVEVKAREIEVEYQLPGNDPSIASSSALRSHAPLVYAWGDVKKLMDEATGSMERTYVSRGESTTENMITFVRASLSDDILRIEAPTQWPHHVRDTVADVCGKPKKKVVVTPIPFFSLRDEKLIYPSGLAAIASLATIKSGRPVQIGSRFPTYKPNIVITRKTALDPSNRPIAESVDATVDQGAFPLFSSEMFKQLLAGLIPWYPLQAFSAQVSFVASDHPPAHFFGDLGYSSALFSSEAHASALATEAQMNPANWRLKHYAESPDKSAVLSSQPFAKLRDIVGDICVTSDFSRHSAVYELQRKSKKTLSIFPNYSRGVGIACGAGISGFSSTFPLLQQCSIEITLDSNDKVTVNTSFFPTQKTAMLWKGLIVKELGVDRDKITFCYEDTTSMVDSGPNVLSQDIERAALMINRCCTAIKAKRFQEPLPLTEKVSARTTIPSGSSLFTSGNWGTLVLELEVNSVTLQVEVRHVWSHFSFSQIYDREQLTAKFRHVIMMSLYECGAAVSHEKNRETTLNITFDDQGSTAPPTSAGSALRGMILAAFSSALSQALGGETNTLPLQSNDILGYVRKSE